MERQDFEKLKQTAYVMSQSACAVVRALGMMAANQQRLSRGESIAYNDAAFEEVLNEFRIHHDTVVETLDAIEESANGTERV